MLGLDDNGSLALFDDADDRVIWDRTDDWRQPCCHPANDVAVALRWR